MSGDYFQKKNKAIPLLVDAVMAPTGDLPPPGLFLFKKTHQHIHTHSVVMSVSSQSAQHLLLRPGPLRTQAG